MAKNIVFLPTCHSTNDKAAEILEKQQVIEGTIIITNNQTAGKGQRGNSWISAPGKNLTFSLILKPTFLSIVQQFDLNIAISLGIIDYLNKIKNGFLIKWPNDIYFSESKICGILIQNSIKGSSLDHAVVGIGLNVNQQHFEEDKPIALSRITGRKFTLNDVFEQINLHLEKRYLQLKRGEIDQMRQDYLNNMYWFGEDHLFQSGQVFNGRIIGITIDGKLEIETNTGVKHFSFKEVEFLT